MRESLYKSYSLRGTELALLLAARKEKSIHCFGIIDGNETRQDYMYSVDHMAKQGIVTPAGDHIIVNPPYRSMIDKIIAAETVVTIRSSDDELSDYCIYFNEEDRKAVVLKMSSVRKNSVLLTEIDISDLFEIYFPEGLIPEDVKDAPKTEDIDPSVFYDSIKMLRNSRVIEDVRLLIGADAIDPVTLQRKSVMVMEMPTGVYTVCSDKNEITAEAYLKEDFEEKLKLMISGEMFKYDNSDDPFRNA